MAVFFFKQKTAYEVRISDWSSDVCSSDLLGHYAPGSYAQYAKLSSISEETGVPGAQDMIKNLVKGNEAVTKTAREIFPVTDKASDEPTADLLTQRMQIHEKTAWMLRSLLEKK